MLEDVSGKLVEAFTQYARRFASSSFLIKLIMVVFASGVMGVSQFNGAISATGSANWWNVAGMVSAILALIGGLLLLVIEGDPARDLAVAHEAIETARELERKWARAEIFGDLLTQSLALSHTYSVMRGALEQSALLPGLSLKEKLSGLLDASHRQIEAAANLQPGLDWTLCVYQASEQNILHLVSDKRSQSCDPQNARSWPIGIGPAGVAYAQKKEVILNDLFAPELGTTFNIPKDLSRDHDVRRFRSVAAIPVLTGEQHDCWGVVIATINRTGYFEEGRFDADTISTDTVRAVAEMIALLVVMHKATVNQNGPL